MIATPLDAHTDALRRMLAQVEAGRPFRDAWEEFLHGLPAEVAYRMEWGSRESIGAIALFARWNVAGPALVVGSGFLGTAPALGILGRTIVQFDASVDRNRFVRARGRSLGAAIAAVAGRGPALPFRDGAFSLVIFPDAPHGLPGPATLDSWAPEVRRVLAPGGEWIVLAHNRLAYKRYTGLHGRFDRPGPLAYARRALDPNNPERTAPGYARALRAAGFARVRAHATYVSHLDYHYVAGLRRGELPALPIGRKERRNAAKWIGYRLGLFPWLTPSVAVIGEAPGGGAGPVLLERIVGIAAGDPSRPVVEELLATRGNAALALARDAAGGSGLVVRVPLCLKEVRLGRRHFEGILRVRALAPRVPTPTPHGDRTIEGVHVYVEERLPGTNGAQLTDDPYSRARTYGDLADVLADLVVERRRADDALLEELVYSRARFVASRLRTPEVADLVRRVAELVAARLRGHEIPVVFAHADLRAKHVLVGERGELTGILDWGTYRERNLPLYDLIHFVIHDRKQQKDESLNAATIRALHPRHLRPFEEEAVRRYCERLGIGEEVRRACEIAYPIEVPMTTMTHWEYDRPRWVEANFAEALAACALPPPGGAL